MTKLEIYVRDRYALEPQRDGFGNVVPWWALADRVKQVYTEEVRQVAVEMLQDENWDALEDTVAMQHGQIRHLRAELKAREALIKSLNKVIKNHQGHVTKADIYRVVFEAEGNGDADEYQCMADCMAEAEWRTRFKFGLRIKVISVEKL